ncbi:MAG: hypothetical protein IPP07_14320 [Holophagales bacterium]|nr:hypothetical protein [Holophagales bacterium]
MSAALVLLAAPLDAAGPSEADLARAAARITAASAFQTVETLSAPGMQGRMSGTDGYRRAADWVVSEVRRAGLGVAEPFGEYRQPFTHGLGGVESASLTVLPIEGEKDARPPEAVLLEDFSPMVNGGSGDVTAEVVFVGFGFHAPGLGRDDYAGVDVKGKVVLALRGEPETGEWKDHRASASRTFAAERAGAAAFLLVDGAVTSTNNSLSRAIPEAMVSEGFADRLLAGQKLTVAELRKVLARGDGLLRHRTQRPVHRQGRPLEGGYDPQRRRRPARRGSGPAGGVRGARGPPRPHRRLAASEPGRGRQRLRLRDSPGGCARRRLAEGPAEACSRLRLVRRRGARPARRKALREPPPGRPLEVRRGPEPRHAGSRDGALRGRG